MHQPKDPAEYWVFGAPSATTAGVQCLPRLLGLEWYQTSNGEFVVNFLTGPDEGQMDVLPWSEVCALYYRSHIFQMQWIGMQLPLYVTIFPGLGLSMNLSLLGPGEFWTLHTAVVGQFVSNAIENGHDHPVLLGCDTRGIVEGRPEAAVALATGVEFIGPDYLLTSPEIWRRSSIHVLEEQILEVNVNWVLVTTV